MNPVLDMEKTLYTYFVKFGTLVIQRSVCGDDYDFKISWSHGQNQYFVVKRISRYSVAKGGMSGVYDLIDEMTNIRDTHIRNVTFWTNCKDVR